jgi:hypothetical protein
MSGDTKPAKIVLSPEAIAGFEAAAIRMMNARHPGQRWRSLRDEPDPSVELRPAARDDDGFEQAA